MGGNLIGGRGNAPQGAKKGRWGKEPVWWVEGGGAKRSPTTTERERNSRDQKKLRRDSRTIKKKKRGSAGNRAKNLTNHARQPQETSCRKT